MTEQMGLYGLRHKLARLHGDIHAVQRKISREQKRIELAQSHTLAFEARIAEVRQQAATIESAIMLAFNASVGEVSSRETHPKMHLAAWGALTRTILATLRRAQGRPLITRTITELVAEELSLELATKEDWVGFHRRVSCILRAKLKEGWVKRLHNPRGSKPGSWVLAASAE